MKTQLSRRAVRWIGVALIAAGIAFIAFHFYQTHRLPQGPEFAHASITLETADGRKLPFSVEVATTHEQLEYGLMHRTSLPADAGMLFLYSPMQEVNFWMKDTPLPLDMLFIRANGEIARIVTHAVPYSMTPIPSGEPVRGVLEVNAGEADNFHIRVGDKVIYSAFGRQ